MSVRKLVALKNKDNLRGSWDNALLELASVLSISFWFLLLFLAVGYSRLFHVSPSRVTLLAMSYTQVGLTILLPSFFVFYIWLGRRFHSSHINASLLKKYNSRSDRIKLLLGTLGFSAFLIGGAIVVGLLSR
jgi:hypothetical protein